MKSNIVFAGPGAQAISGPCAGSFRHAKGRRVRRKKPVTGGRGLSQDCPQYLSAKEVGSSSQPWVLPCILSTHLLCRTRILKKYQPAAVARLGNVWLFQESPKPFEYCKCSPFLLLSSCGLIRGLGKVPVTSGV